MSSISHLARCIHVYRSTAVGRYLTHKLRESIPTQGNSTFHIVSDAEVVEALNACRHCSEILTPGVNAKIAIKKSRKRGMQNCVQYICAVCGGVTTFQATVSEKRKKPKSVQKVQPKVEVKMTPMEQQRIVAGVPTTFRTLAQKPTAEAVLNSFFASPSSSGASLYSLFH